MPYLRGDEPLPEECLFCIKPESEDAEAHILYRGPLCYVILNRYPYSNGHMMVVPYAHVSSPEGMASEALMEWMSLAQMSLAVLREAYSPQGFNLGVNIGKASGAGVAGHVHLHVVPRWGGDTSFITVTAHTRVIPEWLDETYLRLRQIFDRIAAGG